MALTGSQVVVIGGSSGMGLAIAKAATAAGARVVIGGTSRARLDQATGEIGRGATAAIIDVADGGSVTEFFAALDHIDHLVVTAHPAYLTGKIIRPLAEMDLADAQSFFAVKYWGAVRVCRQALAKLTPKASITLLSGAASRRMVPGHTALGPINGAIESFGRQLAKEIAPRRVNVISPGLVRTPAYDAMPAAAREAMFESRAKALPVGRVGSPEDIAEAALFVMANGYVTGAVIDVDGGGLLG